MPEFTSVHHITLSVTDKERSTEWYVETLGLKKVGEIEDEGGRGAKTILVHPPSSLRIVMVQHRGNGGKPFSEFETGLDHLALTVANRNDLETWKRHFEELHVEHSPIVEGATGWLIAFRDPDNVQWEIYSATK